MKFNPQQRANLRVCASCEWIFKRQTKNIAESCPKCEFGTYSARSAYGNKAYKYARTQQPWFDKKCKHMPASSEFRSYITS